MYSKFATIALLGLSAIASARPAPQAATGTTATGTATAAVKAAAEVESETSASTGTAAEVVNNAKQQATGTTGVTLSTGTSDGTQLQSAGKYKGEVFKYPLKNGFPAIDNPSQALNKIQKKAGGTLSNNGPPEGLKADTINALAFVAFNELFEVAFFTDLVKNITNNEKGYTADDIAPADRAAVLANLKVVVAQEELHELNANGAFKANTGKTIKPCTYKFPVDNFMDAITLASTFTDVVLGTLPDIQTVAATAGDVGLIRGVGASLGQEGEQNGFYRSILGKVPSALPFLTGSARNFAYNALLQNFIVKCPAETTNFLEQPDGGEGLIETGILKVLTKNLGLKDVTAKFSLQTADIAKTKSYYQSKKAEMQYLTYVNQQNKALSVKIQDIKFENNAITFKADFPGKTNFLNGLTIAAVTNSNDFTDPADVAANTLFGPGLIEIN